MNSEAVSALSMWIVLLCGLSVALSAGLLVAVLALLKRQNLVNATLPRLEDAVKPVTEGVLHAREAKEAVQRLGGEINESQGQLRAIAASQDTVRDSVQAHQLQAQKQLADGLQHLLKDLADGHTAFQKLFTDTDERQRQEATGALAQLRAETMAALTAVQDTLHKRMTEMRESNEQKLTSVDTALNRQLEAIRKGNEEKLEAMRKTVDEKLHATLEQRLGESFKLVSDRLESVHRGLGEMQTLASGVGDLKKVLTNVKTRGTFGEVQLGNLLDQILTVEQYEKNFATRPGSTERVEFAIKLPGKSDEAAVYLPIDAKFPLEDYQRLVEAQENADPQAVDEAGKALEQRIRLEARTIREKYVEPPHTTDFAVLYLSTEGLYAEVLRRPGLADRLQREHKVVLSGPTVLAALLNSLQMGFRTLAIEKRSSEVWQVLGAVRTEFGKFGEALAHTRKKLEEATNSIEKAQTRNNVLTRRLRSVEAQPEPAAAALLGLSAEPGQGDDDSGESDNS